MHIPRGRTVGSDYGETDGAGPIVVDILTHEPMIGDENDEALVGENHIEQSETPLDIRPRPLLRQLTPVISGADIDMQSAVGPRTTRGAMKAQRAETHEVLAGAEKLQGEVPPFAVWPIDNQPASHGHQNARVEALTHVQETAPTAPEWSLSSLEHFATGRDSAVLGRHSRRCKELRVAKSDRGHDGTVPVGYERSYGNRTIAPSAAG
jgi:hypothetical protein